MNNRALITDLFARAGIQINGPNPWDIIVHNEKLYERLLHDADLAMGEAYMDGWWDCAALDQCFYKIFKANLEEKALSKPEFWRAKLQYILHQFIHSLFNFQNKNKALIVGKRHYDKGNDLFQCMLDKRMVYTCAYWHHVKTLDEAQEQKLDLVCQKVGLKPGMRVLDIGCGWGSFAKYAAEKYGVQVLGITISNEQLELGKQLCQGLDVVLRFQDYRELIQTNDKFDAIVSLGMFEHVGYKNYADYMQVVEHCLKPDGLFLLHTIGSNFYSKVTSKWINKYIFPHGQLPTIAQIANHIEGRFVMEDWQNIGVHYDPTLLAWHSNFNQHWDQLSQNYDERFRRMWNYFLLSSAAAFRARQKQVWQVLLSKSGLPKGYMHPEPRYSLLERIIHYIRNAGQ